MVFESVFGSEQDHFYMREALHEAEVARDAQEVPIGAIIVDKKGNIIARGHNRTERDCSQAGHAELQVINIAGKALHNWRLADCWLYVTLEPCIMCMGCIYLSRLSGLVYGASSKLFGSHLDNAALLPVYKVDTLSIVAGICQKEAATMMKNFFKSKRSSHVRSK